MLFFVIIALVSYILANVYIFVRGIHALGQIPYVLKIIVSVLYFLCALLPFAFMLFRNAKSIPFSIGHFIYQFGTTWLIITLYMLVFLLLTDLIRLFNHSFNYGFVIASVLTISLLLYGYINSRHVYKQVVDIDINKPLAGTNKLKIVGISDWHLGWGTEAKLMKEVINEINNEHPDIILIAGDLIDNSVTPVESQQMDRELDRLEAKMGIYMVPGNHEYISGIKSCEKFIGATKIKLLEDSIITLPCGLQILGRDDLSNRNRLSVNDWLAIINTSKPTIVLDHQPKYLDDAAKLDVTLQFSGHTHHGQFIPISWLTDAMFEISYGLGKREETNYYVSSGVSLWGPPLRIGTNNEIVIFNLTFE